MTKNARDAFMFGLLDVTEPKVAKRDAASNHSRTIKYFMKDCSGTRLKVCKTFFLATFGYKSTASVVHDLTAKTPIGSLIPTLDRRGGLREGPNVKSVNKDLIVAHILTFNPALPHYRRAHAPKRLQI